MHFKKITLTLFLNAFCITPAALAMCTRASVVKNRLSRAASARFSTVKPPVAQVSTATLPATQKPTLPPQLSDSRGDKRNYQGSWQQAGAKDAIKKALGITGAAAIAAIIAEATEIADWAGKTWFKQGFDEKLIPDEFSRAIVRIYSQNRAQCTGFIVSSEKSPGVHFLFTAAHCIRFKNYAHIKKPQNPAEYIRIELIPAVVMQSTDVAVFLIPSKQIRYFQDKTGTTLPAIPAKQLASSAPRKGKHVLLQGYPCNKAYYKKTGVHTEKLFVDEPETIGATGAVGEAKVDSIYTTLLPTETYLPESLGGASGSPCIIMRGKTPEVLGIAIAQTGSEEDPKRRAGPLQAGGCGKLPFYIQEAESRTPYIEAELNKPWLQRFAKNSSAWLYWLKSMVW
ncbi:MAG: trypsin-like serine protease [Epsilonproteobacteria bacterium]|nr:trypsin-like serine protease [Campylobacterota bacterium]